MTQRKEMIAILGNKMAQKIKILLMKVPHQVEDLHLAAFPIQVHSQVEVAVLGHQAAQVLRQHLMRVLHRMEIQNLKVLYKIMLMEVVSKEKLEIRSKAKPVIKSKTKLAAT